jgi:radical SAM enzyme (TIGR01210 family)
MKSEAATGQILAGAQKAGKTYSFNEDHDPRLPAQMWFQHSHEGLVLFIVFYSQACRWSRCLGCNLPSQMSPRHVPYPALMAQVDHVFQDHQVRTQSKNIKKVIISNNGSILDQVTFSSTDLMQFLAMMNLHLPNLAVLSIETRPEYVEFAELEFIARALAEGETSTQLELAVGFEAFDDHIRNEVFDKGLALSSFEDFIAKVALFGYRVKCYFMQKPVPEMSDAAAVADIHKGIDYLSALARQHRLPINMHLNPTYVARGTLLEQAFRERRYFPPTLRDVAAAGRHARGKGISLFIGLNDEGLAVPGGAVVRRGEESLAERIEEFNRTQDYDLLDRIVDRNDTVS